MSQASRENESIESLCERISHNTHTVAEYLRSKNLRFPSFDRDAPSDTMIPPEAAEIQQARSDVINDTQKLRSLMLGPRDYLQSYTVGLHYSSSINTFKIMALLILI